MGSILDCFRGSNNEQHHQSNNILTPDAETRRQTAAEAASRRLQKNETRGVDENDLRRMKQRQAERDRIEEQHAKISKQTDDNSTGGLRWTMN